MVAPPVDAATERVVAPPVDAACGAAVGVALRAMGRGDAPLTFRERTTVRQAVRRGDRLADARLARAAVAHADRYLANPMRVHLRVGLALSAGGVATLAVLAAVTAVEFTAGGAIGLVVGFIGGQLFFVRRMTEPRVRQAREANARVGKVRKGKRRR